MRIENEWPVGTTRVRTSIVGSACSRVKNVVVVTKVLNENEGSCTATPKQTQGHGLLRLPGNSDFYRYANVWCAFAAGRSAVSRCSRAQHCVPLKDVKGQIIIIIVCRILLALFEPIPSPPFPARDNSRPVELSYPLPPRDQIPEYYFARPRGKKTTRCYAVTLCLQRVKPTGRSKITSYRIDLFVQEF